MKEYLYENDCSSMYFLGVTNHSNTAVEVTGNGIARDADGNMIGAGDTCAEFVEARALFLDADNRVIYQESTYMTDHDTEIKPGAMLVEQMNSSEYFDHVEVCFTGRAEDGPMTSYSG